MSKQTNTIGNHQIDTRGRIRTAHRQPTVGASLRLRRAWYNDPPPDSNPPPEGNQLPPAGQTTLTPEQQKLVNDMMANTRKQAEDRARKALLKDLGVENVDDPDAVKSVKGKLTIAQQAEAAQVAADEAAKTELDKLKDQLTAAQKERDDEKAARTATETRRIADKVDGRIEALASKVGALDPSDVSRWLRENHKDEVTALVGEGEKIDDAAAAKLIEKAKAVKAHWFAQARGAGTPSLGGGQTPGMDNKAAQEENFKRARRGF